MSTPHHPRATSSTIITVKPTAALSAPPRAAVGSSSTATTYSMAPAAKPSRYGSAGTISCAAAMVSAAPSGSTAPDSTPAIKARGFGLPSARRGREITAPSGWLKDDATYTAAVATGETTTFSLVNKELPGLRIIKYDRKNMVAMPDVTFEIFRDSVSLGKFRTDEFGEILLTDAAPGTYRAVEVDTGSDGHILVRASGTEPLIRVMGEGKEINQLERIIDDIASVVEHELGVENN